MRRLPAALLAILVSTFLATFTLPIPATAQSSTLSSGISGLPAPPANPNSIPDPANPNSIPENFWERATVEDADEQESENLTSLQSRSASLGDCDRTSRIRACETYRLKLDHCQGVPPSCKLIGSRTVVFRADIKTNKVVEKVQALTYVTITNEYGELVPETISYYFFTDDLRSPTPPNTVTTEEIKASTGLKYLGQPSLALTSKSRPTAETKINMSFTTSLNPTPLQRNDSSTIRCDRAWSTTTKNCVNPNNPPTLSFSRAEMPYIAQNISSAIAAGHPSTLTRATSDDRDANRVAACGPAAKRRLESAQPLPATISNPSCDEYPFASATQGGADAQTKWVPVEENSAQGSQMSTFLRENQVKLGDSYLVEVR